MTSYSANEPRESLNRPAAEPQNEPHDSLYRPVTEQWKKVLFVFNPVAGRSEIRTELVDILEILAKDSYAVTCYPTRCRGDARNIVRNRSEHYVRVICAGGDGTLDEVVSGMMENSEKPAVPIGYIPMGSTNDFAMSLGIPVNAREAAKAAARGRVMGCDLGLFNSDTLFTYVAAFGLFTETSYETPQDLKNMFGHMAYFLQGMMDLGKARKMPTNLLELGDIIQYFNRVTNVSDLVYRFKTSHIVLESDQRVKWTKDGEYAGAYKKVELTNLHQRLKILVPREGQEN